VPTPFQARVIVTPLGTGFQSGLLDIPAGKQFVIKNVSVITRSPEGMRKEVNFYTYIDRNGDKAPRGLPLGADPGGNGERLENRHALAAHRRLGAFADPELRERLPHFARVGR
jgi:hypothetical protein